MFQKHNKFDLSPKLKLGVGRGYSQNQILKFGAGLCLVIAIALTANAVHLLFSGKSENPLTDNAPKVLGATDTKIEASPSAVQFIEYTVQKGDTLFNISQRYNIDWTTLATLNNIKSPFSVKPGQIMKIPK